MPSYHGLLCIETKKEKDKKKCSKIFYYYTISVVKDGKDIISANSKHLIVV